MRWPSWWMSVQWTLVLLFAAAVGFGDPAPEAHGRDHSRLKQAMDELLENKIFKNALVGVYVVTLDTGEVLYSRNADISMIPASNNKLFTTAAALDILGPDYTYRTTLERIGEVKDGVLQGHLVAVGSGDPTISGRFNNGDVTATLREWVQAVKNAGIQRVQGYVIGDDDLWNDDDYGSGWNWKEIGEWYSAPSSALSFNDNCTDIIWTPAAEVGQPAQYRFNPPATYLRLTNLVTTKKKGSQAGRYYERKMYSRDVIARGGIDIDDKGRTDSASVDNPTLFFATVLCALLEEAGVKVDQGPADIDDLGNKTPFKQGRVRIASHQSPPMREIVRVINKRSQNFYADQVLRTLGQKVKGVGGYDAGADVVAEFLRRQGIPREGFRMVDGSGLSWLNRTSPRILVELLRKMRDHQHAQVFVDSLPQGGRDGSLARRFGENSTQQRVAPRVRAKTGLIGYTRTLSGYVVNDSKEELVFSVMLNNFTRSGATQWIDRITTLIATDGKAR